MSGFSLSGQRAALGFGPGVSRPAPMFEHKLHAAERNAEPSSDFAMPGKRKYPMPDRSHAANALSRSSGKACHGKVKAKACSKYPDLPSCKGSK